MGNAGPRPCARSHPGGPTQTLGGKDVEGRLGGGGGFGGALKNVLTFLVPHAQFPCGVLQDSFPTSGSDGVRWKAYLASEAVSSAWHEDLSVAQESFVAVL